MKQISQNYKTGEIKLIDAPIPMCKPGMVLVRNSNSLISIGTERSTLEFGKMNLLQKAQSRLDLVKRFIEKSKQEGYIKVFKEALNRLDNLMPLGYSTSGIVIETGANVHNVSSKDKVVCIGAGFASHAEYVLVPENLCCRLPENIDHEDGSFGMLGAIALHGIRCANLAFGESVAVIGLGLIGLITVQILKAYGCKVIGIDIDKNKLEIAKSLGIEVTDNYDDLKKQCAVTTKSTGVDATLITASTKSSEPVNIGIDISKHGGKVVIVGVADIHPQRNEMWHKEVEIIVSRAAGPGSFDPIYELAGIDYPKEYIRWTENRNLEEFLNLISTKNVNVKKLISHRFNINEAEQVYTNLLSNKKDEMYLGVIFQYSEHIQEAHAISNGKREIQLVNRPTHASSDVSLGVIGAGLFGKAILLPTLEKIKDINLNTVSTSSSTNNVHVGAKYGFQKCTTNYKDILLDKNINSVMILTQHSEHGKIVLESLNAGKHVFVEKPLCVNEEELNKIKEVIQNNTTNIMVGYNRRFSPHTKLVAEHFKNRRDPMLISYRINAGFVPKDHWVHEEKEGGGRIIGEICHFIDFMQFVTNSIPTTVSAERVSSNERTTLCNDNVTINIKFKDGSIGNVFYTASGDRTHAREKVEVFCEGKSAELIDFRETNLYKKGKKKRFKTVSQEIGYREELQHFFDVIRGKSCIMTPNEIFASTLTTFKVKESLSKGTQVKL